MTKIDVALAKQRLILFAKRFKYQLTGLWFTSTTVVTMATLILLATSIEHTTTEQNFAHTVYAAKPLVLGTSTSAIEYDDSRKYAIQKVFERYNCPLLGYESTFVQEADKNNIPYWLVASIAFQESSCGKNVPYVNGQNSYNAYGWGVWGDNVKKFDTWEHGIAILSKYMNERFYSQSITELCDIMKVYTPPSKGSWCAGVGFFRDQITSFE